MAGRSSDAAPSGEEQAVDNVELVVSFLNTLDRRTFTHHGVQHEPHDELSTAAALGRWLSKQGLVAHPRVTRADLADAVALRTDIRDCLIAACEEAAGPETGPETGTEAGTKAGPGASAAVAASFGFPLRLVADRSGGLSLVCDQPRPGAVGQALATLVTLVATAAVRGTWGRFRVCAAPECRWAFYDASRRGDKRWCSSAVCGNRSKTAEYRARVGRRSV